jgi:hypothetical protein
MEIEGKATAFVHHDTTPRGDVEGRRSHEGDFDAGSRSPEEACGLTPDAPLPADTEVAYICIAVDLLGQMMVELQRAELSNFQLAPTIAAARVGIRHRLELLLQTTESLLAAENPTRETDLGRRAKLLIHRLASEMEPLAIQAQVTDSI